jgi:segregation and condensation protein A
MSIILARVSSDNFVSFYSLFTPEEGRSGVVVTFLAIMELIKEQLLDFVQSETFGVIHVKARES